ncbi:MAG TPA: hypothetical protein VFD92_20630 [Candidatus Binatia bacterium]|nr:hypothetical protein [Candidatus Binatia bacterium]
MTASIARRDVTRGMLLFDGARHVDYLALRDAQRFSHHPRTLALRAPRL